MILQEIYLIDITNVERKDLNTLIDNEKPLKNKQEAQEKLIEMSRKDNCTTGNLFDYLYHQN